MAMTARVIPSFNGNRRHVRSSRKRRRYTARLRLNSGSIIISAFQDRYFRSIESHRGADGCGQKLSRFIHFPLPPRWIRESAGWNRARKPLVSGRFSACIGDEFGFYICAGPSSGNIKRPCAAPSRIVPHLPEGVGSSAVPRHQRGGAPRDSPNSSAL